ncbi:HNH endonuclease signature motif containing protein [Blastococcus brunescens]|uniref:HNH endonuclease signature motif containing protein n=1 Tax=Blastococcus brunescens TaxID=1564165 RepID=A0ABZ1B4I0_9ACTN|nr:HNH endonuclease signature motif containing protein [Blastococcus sp. BMG 8361]WRL64733.1 HNH endonuclease signature motif containing protein [Blastococcus sp. BMG 8361]
MADCVQDLILRPGQHGMPPVTIALTLVATLETMLGGAEPGQVEGMLVPADLVRELGYAFGLMPRPAPDVADLPDDAAPAPETRDASATGASCADAERGSEPGPDPEPDPAPDPDPDPEPRPNPAPGPESESPRGATEHPATPVGDRTLGEWLALARARNEAAVREGLTGAKQAILDGTWSDGELRALLDVGALIGVRDLDGTGLAHRPRIAVVDKLRGSLVALTDAAGIRRGACLGPPPETDGYTPGAELDRFVRLRDRRCRFPGCRARARTCDLDHRQEWPDGPTAHENLCCLCEHHHRLKHQAPGWRFDEADDGGLAITMPSGDMLVSHPPRFGSDLDVPPF